MVTFISADSKTKLVIGDKEGQYILLKVSLSRRCNNCNYIHNHKTAQRHLKQTLTELKGKIGSPTK